MPPADAICHLTTPKQTGCQKQPQDPDAVPFRPAGRAEPFRPVLGRKTVPKAQFGLKVQWALGIAAVVLLVVGGVFLIRRGREAPPQAQVARRATLPQEPPANLALAEKPLETVKSEKRTGKPTQAGSSDQVAAKVPMPGQKQSPAPALHSVPSKMPDSGVQAETEQAANEPPLTSPSTVSRASSGTATQAAPAEAANLAKPLPGRPPLSTPPAEGNQTNQTAQAYQPPPTNDRRLLSSKHAFGSFAAANVARTANTARFAALPGTTRTFTDSSGHPVSASFRPGGRVATIHANGITINHGLPGGRTIVTERNGRTIVSTGPHSGYVQRPYLVRGGTTYVQRTYVVNNATYTTVYRGYYYRGVVYYGYVPAYYYHPVYYGWAYNPWPAPVYYNWGWGGAPWYGYYGPYFAPYPVYPTASCG
jgi:hypothetical protein